MFQFNYGKEKQGILFHNFSTLLKKVTLHTLLFDEIFSSLYLDLSIFKLNQLPSDYKKLEKENKQKLKFKI